MKRRDIENAKRPPAKPLDWRSGYTFSDGRTLLSLAENLDQIEQREAYVELLLRHGAAEPPRLEQALPGRRGSR